jgi:hypothetical protein
VEIENPVKGAGMTEPKTHTLDAPGAVLHYDVRSNDASTEPVLLLIGSPMGAEGFVTQEGFGKDAKVWVPKYSEFESLPVTAVLHPPHPLRPALHRRGRLRWRRRLRTRNQDTRRSTADGQHGQCRENGFSHNVLPDNGPRLADGRNLSLSGCSCVSPTRRIATECKRPCRDAANRHMLQRHGADAAHPGGGR